MFTTIAIIAAVIIALIAIVLILASTKPNTFRMQRSATISAAPDKIFPYINDFHNWAAWSPWEKFDPNMKKSFSGAATGKGSIYEWDGNKKVGQGRMEITEILPHKITVKLDFIKPFEGHNTAEFALQPQGGTTQLTWAMYGPCPFMMKIMHLFINMDKMIGKDFESGLTALKALAEK